MYTYTVYGMGRSRAHDHIEHWAPKADSAQSEQMSTEDTYRI